MTNIEMLFGKPKADGTLAPVPGTLTWTPTLGRAVAGSPDAVVLPLPFTITVPTSVDGVPAAVPIPFEVSVEPTSAGWAWKVEENFTGLRRRRFYVTVPDTGSVDYHDLVQVDPTTLLPAAAPQPAWYGYVDGLALTASDAKAAAEAAQSVAQTSQTSALASANAANVSKDAAASSASAADGSKTAAANSASAAAGSAGSASGYATTALGHKNDAATSASASAGSASASAGSASNAASSASAAAGSATAAQGARTGSEAARDASAGSAAAASGHKDAAASSASNAASSASASAGSATTASNAANSALTSANNAASSEAVASDRAAVATTKAAAATTSATNAASSASAAAGSASAALARANDADASKTAALTAKDQAVAAADGFSMGAVTTLPAGSSAAARINGVAPARVIELDIPRGAVPNIQIGTVTTGLPQTNPGPPGLGGPQGIQGNPGDMVTVAGPVNASGTATFITADLPHTRIWTLIGNLTIVLPTPAATKSGTITLVLTQDATGNRTITWPAAVKWPDGIAQQPAAAANTVSVIHLLWTGTAWLGLLGGKSFA